MEITIGSNIKKLRSKNKVTQKQLASYLGVTEQAISRWESGGYPDITILPEIASFFSITTDELLGIKNNERDEKLLSIRSEINNCMKYEKNDGNTLEQARLWAAEYPREDDIQKYLADELCRNHTNGENINCVQLDEAERIYLTLLENTKNYDLRNEVIESLINLYGVFLGDIDKAEEYVNMLPKLNTCYEYVKATVFTRIIRANTKEYTKKYVQEYIEKLITSLSDLLVQYIVYELPNNIENMENKVSWLKKILDFDKLILGKKMSFYHKRAAYISYLISTFTVAQGKFEETCCLVNDVVDYLINSETSENEDSERSVFIDELTKDDISIEDMDKDVDFFINELSQAIFDSVKENHEFQLSMSKLEKYNNRK